MAGAVSPGAIVEIVAGPWVGRIGVVESVTNECVCVRLRPLSRGFQARVMVQPAELAVFDFDSDPLARPRG